MVTPQKYPKIQAIAGIATLVVLAALTAHAQRGDAFRAVIRLGAGDPPLTGFLYAVNDTAVVMLPSGRLSPKGLEAVQQNVKPISIPTKLIRKIKVSKARSLGHDLAVGVLISIGYTIGYVLVFPLNDPADLLPYTAVVTTLSIITADLIYWKRFRPTDPGFTMTMQRYCLKNNGLMVDR